jgi:hypothetical protein
MFASNSVPSDVTYLRSWSADDGVGLGVFGGKIEGWWGCSRELALAREPVLGGAESFDVRSGSGLGTGTDEMYVASSEI